MCIHTCRCTLIGETLTVAQSVQDGTVRRREFTEDVGRVRSTEIRSLIVGRDRVLPANGSSAPAHPFTLVDEHGKRGYTVGDQDSLEGVGSGLYFEIASVKLVSYTLINGYTLIKGIKYIFVTHY